MYCGKKMHKMMLTVSSACQWLQNN
uniref:Uncharacterized protein n=1 Tax=Anguilla anguilla TaxID=7936 RepID=A0A0E9TFI7_ANGAN